MTLRTILLSLLFGLAAAPALAQDAKKAPAAKAGAKAPAAKAAPKKAPKKAAPPVSAASKKKLAELLAGYKFGMSREDVVGVLKKELDAQYDEKIKATTDIAVQDRLRSQKKGDIARINQTYVAFEGTTTGWDASIIEDEFAHKTNESMLERWENQGGKNQRRFFFFHDGKLWKMFVSLDMSILPADKKNSETFEKVMQAQYGAGDVDGGIITWRTAEFHVRAIDKLKTYDALALAIEDPGVKKSLLAAREAKAPPKAETSAVIKAVIDPDNKEKPDVRQNRDAVDSVINAQGAKAPAPKPKK